MNEVTVNVVSGERFTVPLWAAAEVWEYGDAAGADVAVFVPARESGWASIVEDYDRGPRIDRGTTSATPMVRIDVGGSLDGEPDDPCTMRVTGDFNPFTITARRPVYFAETERGKVFAAARRGGHDG